MLTRYDQLLQDIISGIEKEDIAKCASVLESSFQQAYATPDLMNLPVEFADATRLMEDYQRVLTDSSLQCVISLAMAANEKQGADTGFE